MKLMLDDEILGSVSYVLYNETGEAAVVVTGSNGFLTLATEWYNILKTDKYNGFVPYRWERYDVVDDSRVRLQKFDELTEMLLSKGVNVLSTRVKRFSMAYYVIHKAFDGKNVWMVQERGNHTRGEIRGLFNTKEEADDFILFLTKKNEGKLMPLYAYNAETKAWLEHINAARVHAKVKYVNVGLTETRKRMGHTRASILQKVKSMLQEHQKQA